MSTHPPKVLVTQIGLDGHDRGFGQPLVMV
jgi:methylmalonyl-CoA mutase cobalamin-binding subunit